MLNESKKSLVQQAESAFEENIPQKERADYDRTVLAGMKLMNDENTHANMQLVKNPNARNDIPKTVSTGIAGLVYILYTESGKSTGTPTMRPETGVLAGLCLMFKALDMAERGLGIEITNDILSATTEKTSEEILKKFGVTQEDMQKAVAQSESGATQNQQQPPPQGDQPQSGLLGA